MTVSRADIERIAQLASLSVEPELLAELTKQIGAILDYVAQLDSLAIGETTDFLFGPPECPLRADRVRETPMQSPPAAMAPEFGMGYYLVPRLEAFGGDE